jgi:hypothetical protein
MKKLLNNCLITAFTCILFFSCENKTGIKNYSIYKWRIKTSENDNVTFKVDTIYNGIFKFPPNVELSKISFDSLFEHKDRNIDLFIMDGNSIKLYSASKFNYINRTIIIYKLAISKGLNFEEDNSNTFLYTKEFGFIFIRINKGLHYYQTFELEEILIVKNHERSTDNLKSLFKDIYKDTILFPLPPPPPLF